LGEEIERVERTADEESRARLLRQALENQWKRRNVMDSCRPVRWHHGNRGGFMLYGAPEEERDGGS
jgi:hypothetical protein